MPICKAIPLLSTTQNILQRAINQNVRCAKWVQLQQVALTNCTDHTAPDIPPFTSALTGQVLGLSESNHQFNGNSHSDLRKRQGDYHD
jgi:hypothetical protein